MPDASSWIDEYSRFGYADVYTSDGKKFVGEREPMEAPPKGQYRPHIVVRGDNCFSLAGHYYRILIVRPSRLWWAIAEPNGIIDPTQHIRTTTELKIPDFQYILDWLGHRHEVVA